MQLRLLFLFLFWFCSQLFGNKTLHDIPFSGYYMFMFLLLCDIIPNRTVYAMFQAWANCWANQRRLRENRNPSRCYTKADIYCFTMTKSQEWKMTSYLSKLASHLFLRKFWISREIQSRVLLLDYLFHTFSLNPINLSYVLLRPVSTCSFLWLWFQ